VTKSIEVVIGLNLGDEGKGLTTDWLTQDKKDVAVVRFNSGAQAGHTVQRKDGIRHVFHHFGSGTFNGAPTILSRFFVTNPILFWHEAMDLYKKCGTLPNVYVDKDCLVTTPYDVYINQTIEKARAGERHGSCGVGFGETIERAERGFPLRVSDLEDETTLLEKLENIKQEYYPERLKELGIEDNPILMERADERFIRDAKEFYNSVHPCKDTEAFELFDNLVFEGAQGLYLDQNSRDFPYVTRSSTGLENVNELIADIKADVDVYYITRTYLSRHGAGPLPKEINTPVKIVDATNVENDWQGKLRFAPLDYNRMFDVVEEDLSKLYNRDYTVNVMITHCDQSCLVTDKPVENIIDEVVRATGAENVFTCWGPTASDVKLERIEKGRENGNIYL